MKTIKKFRLIIKISILLLIVTSISCKTDIPEEDTNPPKFSLKITGDGFDHTFTNEDDLENIQLNLKNGAEYDILFSGTDSGGVKLVELQYLKNNIEFTTEINAPWTDTNITSLSNLLSWQGSLSNPLTAGVFSGKFIASGQNIAADFKIYVADFGGNSGDSNTISPNLNLYIGNHNTEIITF